MTRRIFYSICTAALAVFLASLFLIIGVMYSHFSTLQRTQLNTQAALTAQAVNHEGARYFDDLQMDGCRITWISSDGAVLYDSSASSADMENHLAREEVQEALTGGHGESIRFSDTLTRRSMYSAVLLDDGSVLRLSIDHSTVLSLLFDMLSPILIVFIIAMILSMLLASRLAKKIVEPLNTLDLDHPLSNLDYDELSPLLRRIDTQQRKLKSQEFELKRRSHEFEAVTANMNDGLVLLNKRGTVLSINPSAKKLLATDSYCIGQNILEINRSVELQQLLQTALSGEDAQQRLEISNEEYLFDASPVISEGQISGVVLLMFNVTEKENSEQMRREFTANVSHELKTPLHSISGYAELMQNGMVRPEDVAEFSGKIYSEAQRMIRLVEDIIRLSRLDEGVNQVSREVIELYSIADDVVKSLEQSASRSGVSLSLTGEAVTITGFAQHIRGIIFNLCDNAIKYNRKNGAVFVTVTSHESAAVVSVRDTGIGIPPEHQSRIFERFYSVDRSHSKEIGGTGLGLSIVKHAAKIHNAKIQLESTVGQGTTITVHFPK